MSDQKAEEGQDYQESFGLCCFTDQNSISHD